MRISKAILGTLFALSAGFVVVPAQAEMLAFHAVLEGKYGTQPTGSDATGRARIKVDTKRQLVSLDMVLDGITSDALWDKLVAAPIGPIHFHKYATAAGGDSVLVLPVPYGASYRPTKRGLRVTLKDYDYHAGAKLLNSKLTFDQFVAALRSGLVVLNIHTDAFNPGEISGRVEKS